MKTDVPVRVAVIIPGLGIGGVEIRQLTVAKSIDRRKVCIDFYCLYDENNSIISKFTDLGYKVHVIKVFDYSKHFLIRYNYLAIFKLAKMLRKERYDLVHTQLPHANTVGRIAAEFAGIKNHIATICNMKKPSKYQLCWDRLLGSRSRKIMCISESVLEFDRRHTLLDINKYTVIYNGIDTDKFCKKNVKHSVKSQLLHDYQDYFVIGSVARLHPQKDFPSLLHSFSLVLKEHNNVLLVIAGDGELMSDLTLLAINLKIREKVLFLGTRTDIPDVLNCIDLFVSASLFEGFGNTVIEAMSMEIPVIVTDIPPYREIVVNNENGIIIPVKQPKVMAEAICKLIVDDNKRLEYGLKARTTVIHKFSHTIMVNKLEKLYLDLGSRPETK